MQSSTAGRCLVFRGLEFEQRERSIKRGVFAAFVVLMAGILGLGHVAAQDQGTPGALPQPVTEPVRLVLVEHALSVTNVDVGDTGPSTGDMIVWGPNALFDEANEADTGATTQGACIALSGGGPCMLTETILFPDGSTLELQGIQAAGSDSSVRTIVGGSGVYRGASGTVVVEPTDDLTIWVKTFEIWL